MSFLLDTNVVSEWTKPQPNPRVIGWLSEVDEDSVFLSAISLAELRRGIERLTLGRKRRRLDTWLTEELVPRFSGRVLAVDAIVADAWSKVVADQQSAGRSITIMDAFIAATASVHGLALVTRDVKDFELVVERLINPWSDGIH
ncbi:MAG: type II toxin-antitoxin system VapC family toxin [Pseudomonadota bacterium]